MSERAKIYQDEKSGVSVAKYGNTANDAYEFARKRLSSTALACEVPQMPNQVVAKVTLREPDVWDADEGKKLALKKADEKFSRYMKNALRQWMVSILADLDRVDHTLLRECIYEKFGIE